MHQHYVLQILLEGAGGGGGGREVHQYYFWQICYWEVKLNAPKLGFGDIVSGRCTSAPALRFADCFLGVQVHQHYVLQIVS